MERENNENNHPLKEQSSKFEDNSISSKQFSFVKKASDPPTSHLPTDSVIQVDESIEMNLNRSIPYTTRTLTDLPLIHRPGNTSEVREDQNQNIQISELQTII